MKLAGMAIAPLVGSVGAATLLVLLGACSAGAQLSATAGSPSTAASPMASVAASPSAGWVVIQPSESVAPAVSQAATELAADPSASEYPQSPTDAVYSIAGVGVSGSTEYVDAYSVAFVCGGGIADDCDRFIGTPEYRILLAPGARFILLGDGMRPNRPVDFAAFRQWASGPDGTYHGNYDLFELALSSSHQATTLTAVYTP